MRNKQQKAFLMADSLVAMFVVALGINLFFICEQQLQSQQRQQQLKLAAARLGKEASDQAAINGQSAKLRDQGMIAQANSQQVVVRANGQTLYQVVK